VNKDNATFIVGGAGFVGSRLITCLAKKNKKHFFGDINDSSEMTIKLDVEDLDSLDHIAGSDYIVNLAAIHRDDICLLSRFLSSLNVSH
jgi:nucleoside-diphosphate-sugar epimerase